MIGNFVECEQSIRYKALAEQFHIWHNANIEEAVYIGLGSVIGSNVFVGRGTHIGSNVHIQHGVFIARGSVIGDDVFIGPNATLTDDRIPTAGAPYEPEPPVLHDGCSIGANAVILPGRVIGKGALVGAGAVVANDVPAYHVVMGIPAR